MHELITSYSGGIDRDLRLSIRSRSKNKDSQSQTRKPRCMIASPVSNKRRLYRKHELGLASVVSGCPKPQLDEFSNELEANNDFSLTIIPVCI
jgi:hypothetical protein